MVGVWSCRRAEYLYFVFALVVKFCDLCLEIRMLWIPDVAFESRGEDQICGMQCPQGSPRSSPIGIFELPTVQCLAIITVIIIGIHGSLPEEVIKHFHESGPLSSAISKTKLSDLISLAILGLDCFLARLKLKCLHFLELGVQ